MLSRLRRRLRQWRTRASASVEFAIVAGFVLLPLLLGGADFISVITAQAQLNTALQALYFFAYTNPTSASNATEAGYIISLMDTSSVFTISMPATMSSGSANASLSYGCFTPPSTTITYQTSACSSGQTQQTLVTYQVTATIPLPFPFPSLSNPMHLSATGTVQVQ
jgi:Flp pilus assembly protein TadG